MRKYLKSFLKWLLAAVLVVIVFIAGIGCKENGAHVFYDVVGWLAMAEAAAAIVVLIVLERRKWNAERQKEKESKKE